MGTESVAEFCRAIEDYLCRKNDGHLIRVVGPSFEVVSGWAAQGVPFKIACEGIDRYFERYYKKGARRRPVKIDFCDADVLDVFDEWRKAVGLVVSRESIVDSHQSLVDSHQSPVTNHQSSIPSPPPSRPSLPAHLERAVRRLTAGRATGVLSDAFDPVIDRTSEEMDAARADARGLRGERRLALVERLTAIDRELLTIARGQLDAAALHALVGDAEQELEGFRAAMPHDAFARARAAAVDRRVRERFGLPVVTFP